MKHEVVVVIARQGEREDVFCFIENELRNAGIRTSLHGFDKTSDSALEKALVALRRGARFAS